MAETIESLYPRIGQTIADAIPQPWRSAWVVAEIKPGVVSLRGHFIPAEEDSPQSLQVSRPLMLLFSQLHTRMAEEMHDDWKQARFDLQKGGKFDLKFEY
jgi:hypothetical protein